MFFCITSHYKVRRCEIPELLLFTVHFWTKNFYWNAAQITKREISWKRAGVKPGARREEQTKPGFKTRSD
jgi:hypothetical protein